MVGERQPPSVERKAGQSFVEETSAAGEGVAFSEEMTSAVSKAYLGVADDFEFAVGVAFSA